MKKLLIAFVLTFGIALLPCSGGAEEGTLGPQLGENVEAPAPMVPLSHAIPQAEIWQWRALDAESRALQAEAAAQVKVRRDAQAALFSLWQERYEIAEEDLAGWTLDVKGGKIMKIGGKQ